MNPSVKDRIYKLVQHAAGRWRQSLDSQTRLLIFFLEPFSGQVEICWPLNNLPTLSEPTSALVQNCFKRQRSIVVHDSAVDPLIGQVSGADFRSAVAVPLFDKANTMMGVVYLDSPVVGALDKEQRLQTERFARGLSERIPPWTPSESVSAAPIELPRGFDVRLLAGVGALLCFFTVAWLMAPEPPKPAPVASSTPILKKPDEVARSFLGLLEFREFQQAWYLLNDTLQTDLPQEAFVEQMRGYLKDERHRWDFQRRKLRAGKVGATTAEYYLDPDQSLSEHPPWKLTLEYTNREEWRLSGIEGSLLQAPAREALKAD